MRTVTQVFDVFTLVELTEAARQAAYADWSKNPWLSEFSFDCTKDYLQDYWGSRGIEIETTARNRRGLFVVATLDIDRFLSVPDNSENPIFAELSALKTTQDYEKGLEIRFNGEPYQPEIDFPDWFYDFERFSALDNAAEKFLRELTHDVKNAIETEETFAYSFENFAEENKLMGTEYLENGSVFCG